MSATTDLLKAKKKYIVTYKCYPTILNISPEFEAELKDDMTFKKKGSASGNYYMGCAIKISDTQEERFIFDGGDNIVSD